MVTLLWLLLLALVAYKAWQLYQWKTAELSFAGKTVFITGGSSGIGEAMTKRLVQLGAKKVVIASRNIKEMERVKNECIDKSRVDIMQMDLSKPEECLEKVKIFV
jgi:NADP-dependent 3-hydroxy acid dehydrogenase YdfG